MLHSHNNAGFDYLFWTMTLWRCLSKYQHLDSWRGRCHQRWVMEQKHEAMRIVCRYLKWVVLNPDGIMWNWNINMYTFFMLTDICQYLQLQPRYLRLIVVNKRWIYAQSCTVAQTCSQLDVGMFYLTSIVSRQLVFYDDFIFPRAIDKNVSDDGKSLLHITASLSAVLRS